MMGEDDICENCVFWQPMNYVPRHAPKGQRTCIGECRARPPLISPDHVSEGGGIAEYLTGAWPVVTGRSFCGAFHACPPEGRP